MSALWVMLVLDSGVSPGVLYWVTFVLDSGVSPWVLYWVRFVLDSGVSPGVLYWVMFVLDSGVSPGVLYSYSLPKMVHNYLLLFNPGSIFSLPQLKAIYLFNSYLLLIIFCRCSLLINLKIKRLTVAIKFINTLNNCNTLQIIKINRWL